MNTSARHIAPFSRLRVMLRAFSNQTRLRILCVLFQRECRLADLAEILVSSPRTIAQHLACLQRAGFVDVLNAGKSRFYNLAPAREPFHERLLECLVCCFRDEPQIQQDASRMKMLLGGSSRRNQAGPFEVPEGLDTQPLCQLFEIDFLTRT
jgi:DNA-binding transcriptional ArsR family regulator